MAGRKFEEIASLLKIRLMREILYELQTGGGMSFADLPHSADRDSEKRQMEAISGALDRLKGLFAHSADRVAERLSRPDLRVLDVGAGKAPWSLAIAAHDSSASVTAVDLAQKMDTLRQAVAAAGVGVSERFRFVAADIFTSAWPVEGDYDLILVANVCHLFDEPRNRELLCRLIPCLHRQGTLAIIDQVLDEDPSWKRWSALYATGALHCAPGGHLFPVRTYADWLGKLGSWKVASHPICPLPPLTLILACRLP